MNIYVCIINIFHKCKVQIQHTAIHDFIDSGIGIREEALSKMVGMA